MNRTPVPKEFQSEPDGVTGPQLSYIEGLIDQKNLLASPKHFDAVNAMDHEEYAAYIAHLKATAAKLTKATASAWITALRQLPDKPKAEQNASALSRASNDSAKPVDIVKGRTRVEYEEILTDKGAKRVGKIVLPDGQTVLAGRYGLDTASLDNFTNDVSFFKVWVGDRGGWSVQLYVSDDTNRVKLAFPTQLEMLKRIALNPEAAMALYGHEFGRCGMCGRGLTNDESRAIGIGPVCRERI